MKHLIPCPACQSEIARNATTCPHCGAHVVHRGDAWKRRIVSALMVGFLLWFIFGFTASEAAR